MHTSIADVSDDITGPDAGFRDIPGAAKSDAFANVHAFNAGVAGGISRADSRENWSGYAFEYRVNIFPVGVSSHRADDSVDLNIADRLARSSGAQIIRRPVGVGMKE